MENLPLTLGKEYRLRLFENRVLKRKLKSKREEAKRRWTKMHSQELQKIHSLQSITSMIEPKSVKFVVRIRQIIHVSSILIAEPEVRRQVGKNET